MHQVQFKMESSHPQIKSVCEFPNDYGNNITIYSHFFKNEDYYSCHNDSVIDNDYPLIEDKSIEELIEDFINRKPVFIGKL